MAYRPLNSVIPKFLLVKDHLLAAAEIRPYLPETFLKAIAHDERITQEDLLLYKTEKVGFFLNYFNPEKGGHRTRTMVIEHNYLSKSYLQDYTNFYASVFHPYDRFCKRIHFFGKDFDDARFLKAILEPAEEDRDIWDSYIGYIVIRPLARAIIGATILIPFPEEGTGRKFPVTRKYKVNLFGKKLRIRSLVFQEQDSVVGSCSSSALWMAFHKTSMKGVFHNQLLSPSDITKSVRSPISEFSGRIFPNEQFTLEQILEAVHVSGLESELINSEVLKTIHFFKALLYAYTRMGLPVLVMLSIGENTDQHLVTVTGYHLATDRNKVRLEVEREINAAKKIEKGRPPTWTVADCITKFYVHDDQIGPFCRIEFIHEKGGFFKLKTGWHEYDRQQSELFSQGNTEGILRMLEGQKHIPTQTGMPTAVIVPITKEIRIQYGAVADPVYNFDALLQDSINPKQRLLWDIYLERSNHQKRTIFQDPGYPQKHKEIMLTASLPKYIWVARAFEGEKLVIELIFDATNIKEADFILFFNITDQDWLGKVKAILSMADHNIMSGLASQLGRGCLGLLLKETGLAGAQTAR